MPELHSCPPAWHRSVSCHSCNTNSTTHSSNTCCMLVPSSTVETVTMPPMSKRGAIAQVQQGNTIHVRRQLHAVSRACAPLGPPCCMAHRAPCTHLLASYAMPFGISCSSTTAGLFGFVSSLRSSRSYTLAFTSSNLQAWQMKQQHSAWLSHSLLCTADG